MLQAPLFSSSDSLIRLFASARAQREQVPVAPSGILTEDDTVRVTPGAIGETMTCPAEVSPGSRVLSPERERESDEEEAEAFPWFRMVIDTPALVPGATEAGTEIPVMTRSGSGEGVRSFPGMVVGEREGVLVGRVAGIPGIMVGRREGVLVGMVAGIPGIMVGRREGVLVGTIAGVPGTGVGRVTGIFPEEEGEPTMMRLLVPMLFVSSSSRTWSAQSAFTMI